MDRESDFGQRFLVLFVFAVFGFTMVETSFPPDSWVMILLMAPVACSGLFILFCIYDVLTGCRYTPSIGLMELSSILFFGWLASVAIGSLIGLLPHTS